MASQHKVIVLDDYQNCSSTADWSSVGSVPVTTLRTPIQTDELVSTLKPFSIICCMRERTPFPKSLLEHLPNLKFLCTTGMRNRAIDLNTCKELGITVSGTSSLGNTSAGTCEQAWGLILALARRIIVEHEAMRQGHWQTGIATSLSGKTLGLIGLGRLGQQVAKVGQAFGMRVTAWSPNMTDERAREAGVEFSGSLENLLKSSDVVSLHIILSDSTRGLLGQKELACLKPTAILINTSRGPLIDEAALLQALPNLGGVGLDTFDIEPLPKNHALRTAANVVLSPHMGLPLPHAAQLPQDCEEILRAQGVTPATIAVLGGRIKVGLSSKQLQELAQKGHEAKRDGGAKLWKIGRRELGAAVVKRMDGGTTVSGTMAIAHLAGIKIFSTGGIGGVHRGAETSFDISSDLMSLADTPVAVVCAGSKSILDIGLTLEYLAPMQLDSPQQVAETILMTDRLGLPSSLLLGVRIPSEFHVAGETLQEAVEQAVRESVENGMSKSGKQVTPWLLGRVAELTKGSSVDSNKALIKNNVKVGGEVAIEYARLLKEQHSTPSTPSAHRLNRETKTIASVPTFSEIEAPSTSLVVVGSIAVDITMQAQQGSPARTTAPGAVSMDLGGVAGNIARAARSIGIDDVKLVAPIARDWIGDVARRGLEQSGLRTDGLILVDAPNVRSATCGILLDKAGELFGGVADMSIAEDIKPDNIINAIELATPKLVCLDGNVSEAIIARTTEFCADKSIPTFFEPTSNAKSLRVLRALEQLYHSSGSPHQVDFATPNVLETQIMFDHVREQSHLEQYQMGLWFDFINVSADALARYMPAWVVEQGIVVMAVQLLTSFKHLFIKNGDKGVVVVQRVSGEETVSRWKKMGNAKNLVVAASSGGPDEAVIIRHFPALHVAKEEVVNVTGAGDNLAGALLAGLVGGLDPSRPRDLERLVEVAQRAAVGALKSKESVGEHSQLRKMLLM
ncbi:hypothetical protein OIO90_000818 [Microbotryomycetes sp. JL221]|nr:hypothetical protein OIO90_000818 [Microbotryomycetes sp. JL221]